MKYLVTIMYIIVIDMAKNLKYSCNGRKKTDSEFSLQV